MRTRVRPTMSQDELEQCYARPWEFEGYGVGTDHPHPDLASCPDFWVYWGIQIEFGKGIGRVESIADLAAGDALITTALAEHSGVEPILGDIAPGYEYQGDWLDTVRRIPPVDLLVMTNVLEHFDDPDAALSASRPKCRQLYLSAAVEEDAGWGDHYWTFDRPEIEGMLKGAGFEIAAYCELDMTPMWYRFCKFGMWACK